MHEIRTATLIRRGWPEHISKVPMDELELSEYNGLLLIGSRIVVPKSMRGKILLKIHEIDQGLIKCRERASSSVWWPGFSAEINKLVISCQNVEKKNKERTSHLLNTVLETMEESCTDLCEHERQNYLLIYSRFIEILNLTINLWHISLCEDLLEPLKLWLEDDPL